jgi:hypothetical protein
MSSMRTQVAIVTVTVAIVTVTVAIVTVQKDSTWRGGLFNGLSRNYINFYNRNIL